MSRNLSVLSVVIAIIIFIRCVFDSIDELVYIVAGINIVAIVFVIYTIIEKIVENITRKIKESSVPKQIVKREITSTRLKVWGISCLINISLVLLYFLYWCSSLGNDIISILALGISVLDDEIVKKVTEAYKI